MPRRTLCPYCGGECDAEFVDIGVGFQQVSPYVCRDCMAHQVNPYDDGPRCDEAKRTGFHPGAALDAKEEEPT